MTFLGRHMTWIAANSDNSNSDVTCKGLTSQFPVLCHYIHKKLVKKILKSLLYSLVAFCHIINLVAVRKFKGDICRFV